MPEPGGDGEPGDLFAYPLPPSKSAQQMANEKAKKAKANEQAEYMKMAWALKQHQDAWSTEPLDEL